MKKYGMAKLLSSAAVMLTLVQGGTMTAWAAKYIPNLQVSINQVEKGDFSVGADLDENLIDVKVNGTGGSHCHVANVKYISEESSISADQAPKIEVILETDDDYSFSLSKKSQLRLHGDTEPVLGSAVKRNSSTELVFQAELKGAIGGAGQMDNADWYPTAPGSIYFTSFGNTGHQIQVLKGEEPIGALITVPEGQTILDLNPYMLTAGTYYYRARAYNEKTMKKGGWMKSSDKYVVSEELAAQNRAKYGYQSRDGFGWNRDEKGWCYKTPAGYVKSDWVHDNTHDFWMNADGYMVTGWNEVNGKWYFMNQSGEKLVNTTTPDGYKVDGNGVWIQ